MNVTKDQLARRVRAVQQEAEKDVTVERAYENGQRTATAAAQGKFSVWKARVSEQEGYCDGLCRGGPSMNGQWMPPTK